MLAQIKVVLKNNHALNIFGCDDFPTTRIFGTFPQKIEKKYL